MSVIADLKTEVEAIGKELVASGVLTKDEQVKVLEWTAGLGLACATQDVAKVNNYKSALNAMLGVAELRAAHAAEAAAVRLARKGLEILVSLAVSAII